MPSLIGIIEFTVFGLLLGAAIVFFIMLPRITKSQAQLRTMQADKAQLEGRLSQLETLQTQLKEKDEVQTRLHETVATHKAEVADLTARIEEQKKQNTERLKEFEDVRQRMATEFENLANRMLEEKSKKFSEQNQSSLLTLIKPMREQMQEFRKRVDEVHDKNTQDQSSLREIITRLEGQYLKMSDETLNLTQALRGDKKMQGNWGEMILERVLEQSGLRKGHEYETQRSLRDDEQQRYQPDVIVHLPEGRDIVIDAKVSLNAYQDYVGSDDDDQRKQAMSVLVQSIRQHIKGLSEKDYSSLQGLNTVDYVLMFMPVEAAFMAAFEQDQDLFSEAFGKNIIVVTPTTLLAVLRTIENIWRYERQNEHAMKIADSASKIYDKLRLFVEDFQKIGVQMNTAQKTYDNALGRLSEGRGNLLRQVEGFRELGVRIKKDLPKELSRRDD